MVERGSHRSTSSTLMITRRSLMTLREGWLIKRVISLSCAKWALRAIQCFWTWSSLILVMVCTYHLYHSHQLAAQRWSRLTRSWKSLKLKMKREMVQLLWLKLQPWCGLRAKVWQLCLLLMSKGGCWSRTRGWLTTYKRWKRWIERMRMCFEQRTGR